MRTQDKMEYVAHVASFKPCSMFSHIRLEVQIFYKEYVQIVSGWTIWRAQPVLRTCRSGGGQQLSAQADTFTQVRAINSMAAMGSLGRVGILSRRGVTLITKSTSSTTMLRQEHLMGNLTRTLVTSARRDERFFTKKHEWVEVDGAKGWK